MSERDQYGTVQAPEPIPVVTQSPYVVSTGDPTMAQHGQAWAAYSAMIRKDLRAQRQQH
jgi:hypothetical protein